MPQAECDKPSRMQAPCWNHCPGAYLAVVSVLSANQENTPLEEACTELLEPVSQKRVPVFLLCPLARLFMFWEEHKVMVQLAGSGARSTWMEKSSSTVYPLRGSRKWLPCSEPQLFLNKMVLTTAASTPVGFVPVLNEIIHVQCLKQSLAQKGSVKTSDSVLTKRLLPYVIGIQFSKVAKAEN